MRIVGLDLGARHIAYCEVANGVVVRKTSVRKLSELEPLLGPEAGPARVAFEACREGWHVHDTLKRWGNEPVMLDTTRIKQIGVGQHGRKNDAIDAQTLAVALETNRVPVAHVLSPERRKLRGILSIREELVDMRARQIVIIRGLARSKGVLISSCATTNFLAHLEKASLDDELRELVAPLVKTLRIAEEEIATIDDAIAQLAREDDIIRLLMTVPGVALIVAVTFVSVIDSAKRFRNAHAVSAYVGLVPSEHTTGGPNQRRLGGITKKGNTFARKMLVQAAWHILRSGDVEDPLHCWGARLANTRGKKIAAIALARRLAGLLWALWRDGSFYDPTYAARESAKGLERSAVRGKLEQLAMSRVEQKIKKRERTKELAPTRKLSAPRRKKMSEAAMVP